MAGAIKQFWTVFFAAVIGISSVALVLLSFFYEGGLIGTDRVGFFSATILATMGFGVLLWQILLNDAESGASQRR